MWIIEIRETDFNDTESTKVFKYTDKLQADFEYSKFIKDFVNNTFMSIHTTCHQHMSWDKDILDLNSFNKERNNFYVSLIHLYLSHVNKVLNKNMKYEIQIYKE